MLEVSVRFFCPENNGH